MLKKLAILIKVVDMLAELDFKAGELPFALFGECIDSKLGVGAYVPAASVTSLSRLPQILPKALRIFQVKIHPNVRKM